MSEAYSPSSAERSPETSHVYTRNTKAFGPNNQTSQQNEMIGFT